MVRIGRYGIWRLLIFVLLNLLIVSPIEAQAVTYEIVSLTYSPDGSEIAVVGQTPICGSATRDSENYAITILDSVTGETLRAVGNDGCAINSVSWSPDGTRLATSSWDGTALVWDATTGALLSRYAGSGYGARSLLNVEWNPVDERIVVQGNGGIMTDTWDALTGDGIGAMVFDVATYPVFTAKWSPDGNRLAIGTIDEKIEIFDMTPANASLEYWPLSIRFDVGQFAEIYWSPDGTQIATSSGLELQIFDASTGLPVKTLSDGTNSFFNLAWSPDGTQIASGGIDGVLRVWDIASNTEITTYDHASPIYTLDWHPNGTEIAFSGVRTIGGSLVDIIPIAQSITCDTTSLTSLINIGNTGEMSDTTCSESSDYSSDTTCSSSCWLGIEPRVTTEAQVENILDSHSITYEKYPLGAEGSTSYFYAVIAGYSHPQIMGDSIIVYTGDGIVLSIDMLLQDVEIADVIVEYGNPTNVLQVGRSFEIIYDSENLAFGVIEADKNSVFNLSIMSDEILDMVYLDSPRWDSLEICTETNQLCDVVASISSFP